MGRGALRICTRDLPVLAVEGPVCTLHELEAAKRLLMWAWHIVDLCQSPGGSVTGTCVIASRMPKTHLVIVPLKAKRLDGQKIPAGDPVNVTCM
jgi:hypothetical protein